ncbi:MAG: tRNA lysidine(34) synthetase TilS [Burkholderiaceae bacterium]|nr:tRNA lysidine(34) synthetase TilS [Burkholderiaceae bacterium]
MARIETAQVVASFERALDSILARVSVSAPDSWPKSIAVAYSGGLDSSVLLHLAHAYVLRRDIRLAAFHVHHGLSPNADDWLAHCEHECIRLAINFDVRRVNLARDDGNGLEAAARIARYAALGEMCRAHRVPFLLTAHHQDDQVETVLLQMLRGAGLAGISGMSDASLAPDLLGDAQTRIVRPLLGLTRVVLADYALASDIGHIEDESNADVRHPRNALRNDLWPLLQTHFPAFRECLARSAQHAQSAQRLLDELAAQDLVLCAQGDELIAERVSGLGADRADNLLRHWLALKGLRMPSSAWLHEARAQLLNACADAQVCVTLDGVDVRRYRNRIMLTASRMTDKPAPVPFCWVGEASRSFPALNGVLYFDVADGGFAPDWLRAQPLSLECHQGGGRLKLVQNQPNKGLKGLYQERGIPAWERRRLPLVYAGAALLFAAGIGQDCRFPQAADGIVLRWERDAA